MFFWILQRMNVPSAEIINTVYAFLFVNDCERILLALARIENFDKYPLRKV